MIEFLTQGEGFWLLMAFGFGAALLVGGALGSLAAWLWRTYVSKH